MSKASLLNVGEVILDFAVCAVARSWAPGSTSLAITIVWGPAPSLGEGLTKCTSTVSAKGMQLFYYS